MEALRAARKATIASFLAELPRVARTGPRAPPGRRVTHPRKRIDVAALAAVMDRHPVKACWLMPNFQNPLGSLMPDDAKQALVELFARREVPLIEDDDYGELYFGTRKPRPAKA